MSQVVDEIHVSEPLPPPPRPAVSAPAPVSRPAFPDLPWWGVMIFVLVLAFAFQGSRGIWEPDEGFYGNVALRMLDSGDWWIPRLNDLIFLDKPPLHYWGMAAGMAVFGVGEWGVRSAHAVWFTAAALLVGLLARALWGRGSGPWATLIYATMLLPFGAATVITPDTLLAFWALAAAYAYWRAFTAPSRRGQILWTLAAGVAIGLGILSKGPAMLLVVAPLFIHLALSGQARRLFSWEVLAAGALALGIGLSWYVAVARSLPDAADYFLSNQVSGRLVGSEYHRNATWYGGLILYLPTLLLGGLPWTPLLIFGLARGRRWWRAGAPGQTPWRARWRELRDRPAILLLVLWTLLPLAVLMVASSRLPLYALPLFAPLALLAVPLLQPKLARSGRRRTLLLLGIWAIVLVALKGGTASWPRSQDDRAMARGLEELGVSHTARVVAVNTKKNGLALYGYRDLVWVRTGPPSYPYFEAPDPLDEILDQRPLGSGEQIVFVVKRDSLATLTETIARWGLSCTESPGPFIVYFLDCRREEPGDGALTETPVGRERDSSSG